MNVFVFVFRGGAVLLMDTRWCRFNRRVVDALLVVLRLYLKLYNIRYTFLFCRDWKKNCTVYSYQ